VLAGIEQVSVAPPVAPEPLAELPHWDATRYEPPFAETLHCQEYGAVPEVGIVPVTVSTWLTSSAVADGDGVAAEVSAELTVTSEDEADVVDWAVEAPSVTPSSKPYVAPAVSAFPAIEQVSVAPPEAPDPELVAHRLVLANAPPLRETSHCQAYGDVPLDGTLEVTESTWSASSEVALGEGVEAAVSAELTVTAADAGDVAVSGVVAPSVTFSSNRYEPVVVATVVAKEQVSVAPALPPEPLGVAHWLDAAEA
jgi:hypothetical protein